MAKHLIWVTPSWLALSPALPVLLLDSQHGLHLTGQTAEAGAAWGPLQAPTADEGQNGATHSAT